MAKGDVRPTRSNYGRGSYGGSSTTYYDDEGRGQSKNVWEWFEDGFNSNPNLDWLLGHDDPTCYWLIKSSTYRFGIMDIATYGNANVDSRARRLVQRKLKGNAWATYHQHLVDGYNREKAKKDLEEHQRAQERDGRYAAYLAQREAEQAVIRRDDYEKVMPNVDMTVGMLSNDLHQAFIHTDRVGDQGEWIDDAVVAYQGGDGFGYDDKKAVGTKIQITLSLDLSNSIIYNGVVEEAATTFRDMGLTLKSLKNEHPGDLFTGFFTFGEDGWDNDFGKRVRRLQPIQEDRLPEYSLAEFDPYRPSTMRFSDMFTGTDTWISPLLREIERWEKEESDPGAVRLDLVLTDAVLEHPKDIRDSDVIQERRNGVLTTVLLNFMPESDWLNSTLPKRCYQMHVEPGNVQGILRNVITEFIQAHI